MTAFRSRGLGAALFVSLLALLILGWIAWPNAFFPAYWFGLMFWTQLSIGCLILLFIQMLTGGEWARASAPLLRLGSAGIFILVPLFLPAFFVLPHIFSWTAIRPGISTAVLVNKQVWLNPAAFIIRALVFLIILATLASFARRPGLTVENPAAKWSGPALVFVIIVLSLASCDWMMSIEPTFYSSLYPFMYFSGAMVSSLAFVCGVMAWRNASPEILHALGKLFFAAVLFWGYILFSQFIIIWTGNLPDEAAWYVTRGSHGWQYVTAFVVLFHFAIPFCLLLSHRLKKNPSRLLRVAVALFLVHFVEVFWLMAPKREMPIRLNPFDLLLPLLIGACWLWFIASLRGSAWLLNSLREEAA